MNVGRFQRGRSSVGQLEGSHDFSSISLPSNCSIEDIERRLVEAIYVEVAFSNSGHALERAALFNDMVQSSMRDDASAIRG